MANAGSRRRRWTEVEARAALKDLGRTGESEVAFAWRTGVSVQRLRYWRERLDGAPTPTFVAVAMPVAGEAPPRIELQVGDVLLRVREDLDVDHLAEIVCALARARQC